MYDCVQCEFCQAVFKERQEIAKKYQQYQQSFLSGTGTFNRTDFLRKLFERARVANLKKISRNKKYFKFLEDTASQQSRKVKQAKFDNDEFLRLRKFILTEDDMQETLDNFKNCIENFDDPLFYFRNLYLKFLVLFKDQDNKRNKFCEIISKYFKGNLEPHVAQNEENKNESQTGENLNNSENQDIDDQDNEIQSNQDIPEREESFIEKEQNLNNSDHNNLALLEIGQNPNILQHLILADEQFQNKSYNLLLGYALFIIEEKNSHLLGQFQKFLYWMQNYQCNKCIAADPNSDMQQCPHLNEN